VVGGLRRFGRDLVRRRHIEVYVVVVVSVALAGLSLVGDVVDDDVRWAAVLAAMALLTYQIVLPAPATNLDQVLHGRGVYDRVPFASRLKDAREVWVAAPTAVNVLTGDTVHKLRTEILSRRAGVVRVVVLDPALPEAVAIAAEQLDRSTDYPSQDVPGGLVATVSMLEAMAAWDVAGIFEHRFAPFSPGFSLVAVDPDAPGGVIIVELHGVHNESIASRMHLELTRAGSEHWFAYWREQLHHLWAQSRPPNQPMTSRHALPPSHGTGPGQETGPDASP